MSLHDYIGRSETAADVVWPPLVSALAATLDVPPPERDLPPLWHWVLFQQWAPPGALGEDGHLRRGGFLPALDGLTRRMWAGGRVSFLAPLHVGEAVTRTTTIQSITEKDGGTGHLVFVTLQHAIAGPGGPAILEEQDIVYRGTGGDAVKAAPPAAPVDAVLTRSITPDPVLLFRYSALTGNAHRIHYDADYVRAEEGYPGLVVHGPLQATWLAALAAEAGGGLSHFAYRGRRPAFAGNVLQTEAWRDDAGLHVRSRDDSGAVCMTAEARP